MRKLILLALLGAALMGCEPSESEKRSAKLSSRFIVESFSEDGWWFFVVHDNQTGRGYFGVRGGGMVEMSSGTQR